MTKIRIKSHISPGEPKEKRPDNGGKAPAVPGQAPVLTREESFIKRCIDIISDDWNYKLHGIKTEDREKWESFERFEELARGER